MGGHGTSPSGIFEYNVPRMRLGVSAGASDAAAAAADAAGMERFPLGFPPRSAFVSGPAARALRHCLMSVIWRAGFRDELYP